MNTTQHIGSLAAIPGVALLLCRLPRAQTLGRAVGLATMLGAWIALAATLIPSADAERVLRRVTSAGPALALIALALTSAGVVVVLVRIIVARPWIWFVMLAVALPLRIPVRFGTGGDNDHNLLVPLYVVIVLGLAAWIYARATGRAAADGERASAIAIPLALMLAMVFASMLWTSDPAQGTVKIVFFYIPFTVLFLLVVAWWPEGPALKSLCWTTAIGGTGVAVLAVGQYVEHDIFWNERLQQANVYSRFFRVNGIFFDPNILGRFLVLGIVGAVAVAVWWRTPRSLAVAGVLVAVQAAGLAVTFSRSSCLQLLVGLALVCGRAFGVRRVVVVAVSAIVIGTSAAAAGSGNVRQILTNRDRLSKVSEGRFDLVKGGLAIWRTAPVVGVGIGGFEREYEHQLTESQRKRIRVVISHNTPVTVLSELGIVGFGLFALLLAWGGHLLVRRSRGPDARQWAAWTGLALIAGILVHSMLYAAFFEDPYVWAIAGASLALLSAADASVRRAAS